MPRKNRGNRNPRRKKHKKSNKSSKIHVHKPDKQEKEKCFDYITDNGQKWKIGDICVRNGTKCVIKHIDFLTHPPNVDIEQLLSGNGRIINTEFDRISKPNNTKMDKNEQKHEQILSSKPNNDEYNYYTTNSDQKEMEAMFDQYKKRIDQFEEQICEFPVINNNILSLQRNNEIYNHMKQCYHLLHGSVLILIHRFLLIKKKYGSNVEKKLYENMNTHQFIHRLVTKRAVVFYKQFDSYLLRNGCRGAGKWELIGTNKESNISINNYLSYDELLISALCGISSPTHFINNGYRQNCGQWPSFSDRHNYPLNGIYIGLVGARFEKQNCMENSLMLINKKQNINSNGYGKYDDDNKPFTLDEELNDELFMNRVANSCKTDDDKIIWRVFERFYSRNYFPTYAEIQNEYKGDRFYQIESCGSFLDKEMFMQRIRISLELFLFDADKRAKTRINWLKKNQKYEYNKLYGAYCTVIGLGTGVWAFDKTEQDRLIVLVIRDIIKESNLEYIDVIYFSWMDEKCMYESVKNEQETIFLKEETKDNIENKNKNNDNALNINDDDWFNNDVCYFEKDKLGHKISIKFGYSNPGNVLLEPYDKCLIVSMYAWDSNAFPGNEYYLSELSTSGDPAAASCSTISFVQNSQINKEYVNGENSGIYFFDEKTGMYEFYKLKDIDLNDKQSMQKWLKKSVLSTPYKRNKFNTVH